MKPTFDIQLIGLSQTLRNNIKTKVEEFIERKDIWEKMEATSEYENEEGKSVLFMRIPFFEAIKRDAFKEKIKVEAQGVWNKCEVGSYVALHACDHNKSVRQGCKVRKILEK